MKKSPFILLALVLSAVLCFAVLFPTAASGNEGGPDAIVGARLNLSYHQTDSYDVMVSSHRGGAVSPSVSDCPGGGTVYFSVAPDGGYEIASISVISAGGDDLEVRRDGEGYSFTMPYGAVVIDVTFQYARQ